jgi:hypothetical protein
MKKTIVLAAALVHSVAGAGTLHGDKSENLTYALRYAGIKPTAVRGAYTFQVAAVDCIRVLDPAGNLSSYRCTIGTTEVKDAAAYLLYTAMTAVGFAETAIAETQIQVSGKNLSCTLDPAKPFEDRFACTSDRILDKPVIVPKKVKVKDTVQPVHIEKQ